jgi:hypothetical protein
MATKIKWTEDKIQQLQAEGRGKGIGSDYQPWIQVSDFSSQGNSRRAFSQKTGRIHHLLSDVEWQLFLLLEHAPSVIDIREQFPLPRDETLSIAAQKTIKHPIYPGTKVPTVMTCDFVVTSHCNGQPVLDAYSCKHTDTALNFRDLEKLEIERTYFSELEIPHHLVFHSELPQNKIKNLKWCRGATINDAGAEEYEEALSEHTIRLVNDLRQPTRSCSLSEYCKNYDRRTGAAPGTGLRVVRALLWRGELNTDLNQTDLLATPMAMFRITEKPGLRAVGA